MQLKFQYSFQGMAIQAGKYSIGSVYTPGAFLSMDGSGMTSPSASGGGSLSSSWGVNSLSQQFFITPVAENSNIYTIQSAATPGIYLRMDGHDMTERIDPGAGVVNCQKGAADQEKLKIIYNGDDGSFSIESKEYPFVFLRMDVGKNIVNCQYGAYSYERFNLRLVR